MSLRGATFRDPHNGFPPVVPGGKPTGRAGEGLYWGRRTRRPDSCPDSRCPGLTVRGQLMGCLFWTRGRSGDLQCCELSESRNSRKLWSPHTWMENRRERVPGAESPRPGGWSHSQPDRGGEMEIPDLSVVPGAAPQGTERDGPGDPAVDCQRLSVSPGAPFWTTGVCPPLASSDQVCLLVTRLLLARLRRVAPSCGLHASHLLHLALHSTASCQAGIVVIQEANLA